MANNNSSFAIEDGISFNDFLPKVSRTTFVILYMVVIPINMILAIFGNVFSLFALKRLSENVNKSNSSSNYGKLSSKSKKQGYFYQYLIIITDLITLISTTGTYNLFQ